MNSIDEIIELYKRDVDVTLIDEMLKLSVDERMRNLEAMREFAEDLRPPGFATPTFALDRNESAMNSIDEIIQIYKRDVDVTLIDESLKHTPDERLRSLEDFMQFVEDMRAAMEPAHDKIR